ncbi:MAG: lycopene cyclase domain-containing protein [Chloroflexi bacterium]|nr:lycopene cyclase domain-containing protein [Chloroflexota bacterium]
MKYFGFLARFVVVPLMILGWLTWRDNKRGKTMPANLSNYPAVAVLAGHVATAIAYTTPWDNYLVATKVWWYDRKKVTGLTLGWVPIEEYTFFVLQSLLTGLWTLWWAKRLPTAEAPYPADPNTSLPARLATTGALGALWTVSAYNLWRGHQPGNYLNLTLAWALPPIMLQTLLGGDILWRQRKLIALGIIPATLYLSSADSLAIGSGTWTINPAKTLNLHLPNKLPLEEGLFFLLTNTLLVFGMILVLSPESERRIPGTMRKSYFRLKRKLLGEGTS